LGLNFHIITGDEEAQLALEILKHDFPDSLEHFLVIDIGGGSAEISAKYEVRSSNGQKEPESAKYEVRSTKSGVRSA